VFFLIILLLIRRHVLLSRNAMRLALDRGLIIHRSRSTVNLLEVCITMLGLQTLPQIHLMAGYVSGGPGLIPFSFLGARLAIKTRSAMLERWYGLALTCLGIFFLFHL